MSRNLRIIFTIFGFLIFASSASAGQNNVHFLERGDEVPFKKEYTNQLQIFCYRGKPKYVIHIWQSVIMQFNLSSNDFKQFESYSPEMIEQQYLDQSEIWSFNLFSLKQKTVKLNPFNTSCIGIVTKEPYSVYLNVISIDLWKILLLVTGLLTFLSAEKLSKNTTFHYVCGIVVGICASFLILIYLISKLFPRKPFMYGVLGCGWTVVIYVLQILWENLRTILVGYRSYLVWYTVITGLISFIFCYRWGPVESERTKNLIKWVLQAFSLIAIYYSSHYQEAAMGQIIILLVIYNTPQKWINAPKSYWKKKFPPKVQMLSTDEYYEQGVRETAKALEQLRTYCSSPDCNQWKTALKLKDVKRFASFIEGNSHLSDEEVLEYETSIHGDLTDDEANDFTDDEVSE